MRLLAYIVSLILFISCVHNKNREITADLVKNPNTASGKAENDNLPKFLFKEETHDFGKIIEGEKVSFPFVFKNSGKSDLLIFNATASCGCTVPEYPKKPIHAGEEGTVIVSFNSEGKNGMQMKTVTLMANTQPNTKVLTIKGEVYKPESK